jgi:DivIVA domain-containing protein
MALTPEDVVNKRFQPTKFREGYDQDEVDDFLDEVVVELRRLNQENEELRQRLIASEARINQLQSSAAQPAPVGVFDQAPLAAQPAPAPAPAFSAATAAPADPSMDPANTNNLLQLARRLHEEHVREGIEKRDALIAEGQAAAGRVLDEGNASAARAVEDGQAQAARIVEEAQNQTRQQISSLDQERAALESRVEELRNFEREYRLKLKGYIEGQLRELDSSAAVLTDAPASAPASAPVAPSQDAPFEGAAFDYAAASQVASPPPANYPGFATN